MVKKRRTVNRLDDDAVVKAIRRVKQGSYVSDVAHDIGISASTLAKWCFLTAVTYKRKPHATRDWNAIKAQL